MDSSSLSASHANNHSNIQDGQITAVIVRSDLWSNQSSNCSQFWGLNPSLSTSAYKNGPPRDNFNAHGKIDSITQPYSVQFECRIHSHEPLSTKMVQNKVINRHATTLSQVLLIIYTVEAEACTINIVQQTTNLQLLSICSVLPSLTTKSLKTLE